jgi:hypothetical protein
MLTNKMNQKLTFNCMETAKKARDKKGYGPGTGFIYLETNNGDVVFRPVNTKPKMSIIARLKRFKGLQIPQIKTHCPHRL